jgi:hypothetical protein
MHANTGQFSFSFEICHDIVKKFGILVKKEQFAS